MKKLARVGSRVHLFPNYMMLLLDENAPRVTYCRTVVGADAIKAGKESDKDYPLCLTCLECEISYLSACAQDFRNQQREAELRLDELLEADDD